MFDFSFLEYSGLDSNFQTSPGLNSRLLESSGGVFGFEGYLVCLLWFHEARGQRFSCAGAVRPKRLVYPRKYMRRDRNGWVAQVRQKFWLRAVLFLFVAKRNAYT